MRCGWLCWSARVTDRLANAGGAISVDQQDSRFLSEFVVDHGRPWRRLPVSAIEADVDVVQPVKDSLEAAIAIPAATPEQLLEGVHATLRQLSAALERNKVLEISPAAGEKFDPHRHQAISVVPAEQDANTVVTVLQKGYAITDRVLRPALVTVAAAR